MSNISIKANEGTATLKKIVSGQHSETSIRHPFSIKLDVDNAKISIVKTAVINRLDTTVFILRNTLKHETNIVSFDFVTDGRVPSSFKSEIILDIIFSAS
ncbi:MAG: hypothetical protein JKY19_13600 [Alcanivoracaceae bacterium]|nr:hypothetical protein [Alcanivoracaceae bacterium]